MKKIVRSAMAAVFVFTVIPLCGQTECRVLMPGIAGSYIGECRKGLAEGKGEAVGTDSYKGSFRKGLPDGEGTYVWASGAVYTGQWKKGMRDGQGTFRLRYNERDSVQTGLWKEDQFIGTEQVAPYLVSYRLGVTRTSFFKQGSDDKYVSFKFSRSGGTSYNIEGLVMQGSSGSESITTAFTGFLNTSFPFEGKVQFRAPNLLNTVINNYELRFVINQPGDWVVTIYY
ncbi:MAG: hypothetical protein MUE37_04355 [Bacteroidales bacterium]|nr:hypothetical protein [Bacteroidales bacterium]